MEQSTVVFAEDGACLMTYDLREWKSVIDQAADDVLPYLIKNQKFKLYGKECTMRRSLAFFANKEDSLGYFFSGQIAHSQDLPESLQTLLFLVNDKFGSEYNGVLVNRYENGKEYISDHRDDEGGLDGRVGVLSISVGAVRTFRVKEWHDVKRAPCTRKEGDWHEVLTRPYHGIMMSGDDFQKNYTHGVPEDKTEEWRMSFTFRKHDISKEKRSFATHMRNKRKRAEQA